MTPIVAEAATDYLSFIADFLKVEIGMISTGPERDATIVPPEQSFLPGSESTNGLLQRSAATGDPSGFSLPRTAAQETVDLAVNPETVCGRVLAQSISADRDYPPFNRSTRDGFAVGPQTQPLARHLSASAKSRQVVVSTAWWERVNAFKS